MDSEKHQQELKRRGFTLNPKQTVRDDSEMLLIQTRKFISWIRRTDFSAHILFGFYFK